MLERASIAAAAALLIFLFPAASIGATAEDMATEKIFGAAYETEKAEFLYHSGDYIGANIAAKTVLSLKEDYPEKDRAAAIRILTDLKLMRRDVSFEYSLGGASFETFGWILDELLKRGEFKHLSKVTSESKDPYAAYYTALTLYAEGKYALSEEKLSTVPESSRVHPYALALTAQIRAYSKNYVAAARLLKSAEVELRGTDSLFIDTVRLLRGYALYEIMEYQDAADSFLSVTTQSPLYKKAMIGAVWAFVRVSHHKRALSILDGLRPLNPYSIEGRELLLAEAYCHYALGNDKEALAIASKTLDTIEALASAYDEIAAKGVLPGTLSDVNMFSLSSREPVELNESTPKDAIIIESLRLASAVRDKFELEYASNYFKAYDRLKADFDEQSTDIDLSIEGINKAANARAEWLKEIKAKSVNVKALFMKIKTAALEVLPSSSSSYKIREHGFSKKEESGIIERWEKTLNRRLSEGEKSIIRLSLLDGEGGSWYLNNTQYSQFLYWMAIDPSKKDGRLSEGALDRMVKDLLTFASSGSASFEDELPGLEKKIEEKKKTDEAILSTLYALKVKSAEGSLLSEGAKDKIRTVFAATLIKRAKLMKYEIRLIEEKFSTLIRLIKGIGGGI